jgi:ubiquinone biosynthesis protein
VRPAALFRACVVCAIVVTGTLRLLLRLAWTRRPDRARMASTVVTETLQHLGPAFIKAGQLLGTRIDVLPRPLCAALGRLYDDLPVAPVPQAMRTLPAHLLANLDGAPTPVAAGSIACVYRARTRDGQHWALKVRRPGIARRIDHDLALFRTVAAALQWLPFLRGAPVAETVSQLSDAIRQQSTSSARPSRFAGCTPTSPGRESGCLR